MCFGKISSLFALFFTAKCPKHIKATWTVLIVSVRAQQGIIVEHLQLLNWMKCTQDGSTGC
jgi:hypothetical protein